MSPKQKKVKDTSKVEQLDSEQRNLPLGVASQKIKNIKSQLLEQFKMFEFLFHIIINEEIYDENIDNIIRKMRIITHRLNRFLDLSEYKIYPNDYSVETFFNDYKKVNN